MEPPKLILLVAAFQFALYCAVVIVHTLGQHLGVSLRLSQILLAQHLAHVFELGPVAQHHGGEGVTRQVRVHAGGDTGSLAYQLQRLIIVGIVERW